MTIFMLLVTIIAVLFLVVNLLLAPHNPYQEKYSIFECGFHSFLGQNRIQFTVKFFMYAFLFLIFDLEITLVYPFAVSGSSNYIYGLFITIGFLLIVTIGFIYELGKGALHIDSKQSSILSLAKKSFITKEFIKSSNFISQAQIRKYSCFTKVTNKNNRYFHTTNSLRMDRRTEALRNSFFI